MIQPLKSKSLDSVEYFPDKRQLSVKFKDGGVYIYSGVAPSIYGALLNSKSKGSFFAEAIRDKFKVHKR